MTVKPNIGENYKLLDAYAMSGGAKTSETVAIPVACQNIGYQVSFEPSGPAAVSVSLFGSQDNVNFVQLYNTTSVTGAIGVLSTAVYKFIQARLVSVTTPSTKTVTVSIVCGI